MVTLGSVSLPLHRMEDMVRGCRVPSAVLLVGNIEVWEQALPQVVSVLRARHGAPIEHDTWDDGAQVDIDVYSSGLVSVRNADGAVKWKRMFQSSKPLSGKARELLGV